MPGINTVKHAQKVTRAPKVHAVLGGFHLTGPMMEPIIGPTIGEMKEFGPEYIVPMHCTGWQAIDAFKPLKALAGYPGVSLIRPASKLRPKETKHLVNLN
jgi:metal-dependent hydrolase (beta-lactamase superfamily II)